MSDETVYLLDAHRVEFLESCREHLGMTEEEAEKCLAYFEAESLAEQRTYLTAEEFLASLGDDDHA